MSIMKMQKLNLVARSQDRMELMATLQNAGLVHINPLKKIEAEKNVNDQEIDSLLGGVNSLSKCIHYLERFRAKANTIPVPNLDQEQTHEQVRSLVQQYELLEKKRHNIIDQLNRWRPFGKFEEDFSPLKQMGIRVKLLCLEQNEFERFKEQNFFFEIVKTSGELIFLAIFLRDNQEPPEKSFDPPAYSLSHFEQEIENTNQKMQEIADELSRWSYQKRKLEKLLQEYKDQRARLFELKKAKIENDLFGISAYILQDKVEDLKRVMLNHIAALQFEQPKEGDHVPVELNNHSSYRGFEAIIRAFTGVNYFEKDKTFIVSLLFVFFGALCLLDAGYGILLLVTGYFLSIKNKKQIGQVFLWTGLFSTILGLLCGQFFGLVFAKDILLDIPPLFSLATDPLVCFNFSLLVGLFAMALSYLVAIVQDGIKTHSSGSFFAIVGGAFLIVANNPNLYSELENGQEIFTYTAYACFGLTIISWVVFPEPVFGKKSHVANLLWTLYSGPVGLIQDVLSHMRLFGIALSGSILALVINKIASMMPFALGIVFAPLGHFFVFLLALLSLYIHTNRLIFLEFGSKCMSGGSFYFTPFSRKE